MRPDVELEEIGCTVAVASALEVTVTYTYLSQKDTFPFADRVLLYTSDIRA